MERKSMVGRILANLDRMPKVCAVCEASFEGKATEGQQADGSYRCPRCR